MTRAAIYVRISRDYAGEALGVARQTEDCVKLADSLGWEVTATYTDNDASATSSKARPGYQQMLADIRDGQVDAILAWHPDRLYRKVTDLGELVDVAKRHDLQIATVNAGNIDLTTPTGRLVAGLLAQVATYEVEHKSERWARSWRQGRELGVFPGTGTRLFGYTRDGVVVPAEAEVARRMAGDVLAGVPLHAVARWLEAEGWRATRGRVWTVATMKQYLRNPRIAGWSTLGGEIVGEGQWEPLLDREQWEAVRALLDSRTRPYVPRQALLTGLVFCGAEGCGFRMVSSRQRGKRTYRCPNRPGMPGCGRVSVNADPVDALVSSYAEERLADPQVLADLVDVKSEVPSVQGEIVELQLRIKELEQQLDRPGTPVATILGAIDRARERQEVLLSKVAAQPRVAVPSGGSPWPVDLHRRRALIELVVSRVVVAPATGGNRFNPERVDVVPVPTR